jgi:hypothetical protein
MGLDPVLPQDQRRADLTLDLDQVGRQELERGRLAPGEPLAGHAGQPGAEPG